MKAYVASLMILGVAACTDGSSSSAVGSPFDAMSSDALRRVIADDSDVSERGAAQDSEQADSHAVSAPDGLSSYDVESTSDISQRIDSRTTKDVTNGEDTNASSDAVLDVTQEDSLSPPDNLEPTCGDCVAPDAWTFDVAVQGATSHLSHKLVGDTRFLAFQTQAKTLGFATDMSGAWIQSVEDDTQGVGSNVSIAIDANGRYHISHMDLPNTGVVYTTNANGPTVSTVVDQGVVGFFTTIAVDKVGALHLAYRDTKSYSVEYAYCLMDCIQPSSWDIESADIQGKTGKFNSLALNSMDVPSIAFHEEEQGALKVADRNLEGWKVATVDTGVGAGWLASLAIGPDDSMNVAYIHQGSSTLRFAGLSDSGWQTQTVDVAQVDVFYGQGNDLAVDKHNRLHIAWTDDSKVGLRYAWCPKKCGALCCDGGWNSVVVDSKVKVGQAVSLALDSKSRADIAYVTGFGPATKIKIATAKCAETGCF